MPHSMFYLKDKSEIENSPQAAENEALVLYFCHMFCKSPRLSQVYFFKSSGSHAKTSIQGHKPELWLRGRRWQGDLVWHHDTAVFLKLCTCISNNRFITYRWNIQHTHWHSKFIKKFTVNVKTQEAFRTCLERIIHKHPPQLTFILKSTALNGRCSVHKDRNHLSRWFWTIQLTSEGIYA